MIWYDYEEYENEEEKYLNEKQEELLFDSGKTVKTTDSWNYDPDFARWATELRDLETLVDLFP